MTASARGARIPDLAASGVAAASAATQSPAGEPGAPLAASADRCVIACNALQSMKRATALLCDLTGSDDARCTSSEERVANARAKVRASCGACAD